MDVLKDFIYLSGDPKTLKPEQVLEVVRKQGFEGTIVPDKLPEGNDN